MGKLIVLVGVDLLDAETLQLLGLVFERLADVEGVEVHPCLFCDFAGLRGGLERTGFEFTALFQ